nr:MAG TPA: hypothetical protein [Caudoviricetes sp.]
MHFCTLAAKVKAGGGFLRCRFLKTSEGYSQREKLPWSGFREQYARGANSAIGGFCQHYARG